MFLLAFVLLAGIQAEPQPPVNQRDPAAPQKVILLTRHEVAQLDEAQKRQDSKLLKQTRERIIKDHGGSASDLAIWRDNRLILTPTTKEPPK